MQAVFIKFIFKQKSQKNRFAVFYEFIPVYEAHKIDNYFCLKLSINNITILFIDMQYKNNTSEFEKFLVNNQEYLDEKYNQYFQNKSILLQNIRYENVVKYIYDVFQLDRAKSAPQMKNKVQQSLKKSVEDFFKNHSSNTFGSPQAIKLLGFCIANNDLFAVHYDMSGSSFINPKTKKQRYQNNQKANHPQQEKISHQINNSISQIYQDNINGMHNQFSQKFQQQHLKDQSNNDYCAQVSSTQLLMNSNQHLNNSFMLLERTQNEFDKVQNESPISAYDKKIVKKNIKLAFDFYCKQQMAIGVNNTFDYLEHQKSTMNIGGFLIFAQYCNLIDRQLSKQFLMGKFRKVSEGNSQIDFDTFYLLIVQLQVLDSTLYARSKLDSPYFIKQLRAARLAFNTKDQNPRQLVGYRRFSNKLTGHSGKFQLQLQQDYIRHSSNMAKIKKQSGNMPPLSTRDRYNHNSQIIKTRDLQKQLLENKKQLQFIQKIISPQDNDNKWLHEYQIDLPIHKEIINKEAESRQSKIIGNMKQRISQLQHRQKVYSSKRKNKKPKQPFFIAKK